MLLNIYVLVRNYMIISICNLTPTAEILSIKSFAFVCLLEVIFNYLETPRRLNHQDICGFPK